MLQGLMISANDILESMVYSESYEANPLDYMVSYLKIHPMV